MPCTFVPSLICRVLCWLFQIIKLSGAVVSATIDMHAAVSRDFLPSAVKFHYNFNMRDMANIFQGMCSSQPQVIREPLMIVRQWIHECHRVFSDRLVNEKDMERFSNIQIELAKKHFEFESEEMQVSLAVWIVLVSTCASPCVVVALLQAQPLVFVPFEVSTGGVSTNVADQDTSYRPVPTMEHLRDTLMGRLAEYNESHSAMDLVLFDQAAQHVARIARIIANPRGNALLVGVGGSGKQSLCKLAASVCGYSVFQLAVTGNFGINDLKEALKDMCVVCADESLVLCLICVLPCLTCSRYYHCVCPALG